MTSTLYKFKEITTVPDAKAVVDIVLSKTQRKTPTQIHPQFKISRVRAFYMRKVKFCQQTFRDKMSSILQQFPRLDEIHPFYSDLCNVLYDRDHYKLALGQINAVRSVVDSLGKDYVRLLKYADSHYKCKMLKRAALGRMVTAVKKLQSSLQYLEEVRQHLSRLPSINPSTRTLILAGYPNVGKSSFMNLVSNANVDVQPYAFTTKSLFVGHFDYQYARWQVIDTPGILDHPLEQRNTIEMTAITALAHLTSAVIYFVDVSEQCGFSLTAQAQLYHSIKPLFRNKPLVIVLNKIDARPLDTLKPEENSLIEGMREGVDNVEFVPISCLVKLGVDEAKNKACEALLAVRVQSKVESKKIETIANRLTVTTVTPNLHRPHVIPPSVIAERSASGVAVERPITEKQLEEEHGGAGVYSADLRKKYLLKKSDWRYDVVPEIMDGRNISDFVDIDIEKKLHQLEEQERRQLTAADTTGLEKIESDWAETQLLLNKLTNKMRLARTERKLKLPQNSRALPRKPIAERTTVSAMTTKLDALGYDTDKLKERVMALPFGSSINVENATPALTDGSEQIPGSTIVPATKTKKTELAMTPQRLELHNKLRKITRGTLVKLPSGKKMLLRVHKSRIPSRIERSNKTLEGRWRTQIISRRAIKARSFQGRAGEGDRFIGTAKPRHLYSGKRGIGKTQRR